MIAVSSSTPPNNFPVNFHQSIKPRGRRLRAAKFFDAAFAEGVQVAVKGVREHNGNLQRPAIRVEQQAGDDDDKRGDVALRPEHVMPFLPTQLMAQAKEAIAERANIQQKKIGGG